jgi:hypothetical protein
LHFRGTGVLFVNAVSFDQFVFRFGGNAQLRSTFPCIVEK